MIHYKFTAFPNELLSKAISTKFNGTQYAILMALIRATIGFQNESRNLGIRFFVKVTKRNRDNIAVELQNLIKWKVIIVEQKQTFQSSRMLRINNEVDEWMVE